MSDTKHYQEVWEEAEGRAIIREFENYMRHGEQPPARREMGLCYPSVNSTDEAVDMARLLNRPVRVWVVYQCGHTGEISRAAWKVYPSGYKRDTRVTD
tara:strand:+ start:150 stop:443 length:294 start_codon:yes stop_codon:yes gene_type:complete